MVTSRPRWRAGCAGALGVLARWACWRAGRAGALGVLARWACGRAVRDHQRVEVSRARGAHPEARVVRGPRHDEEHPGEGEVDREHLERHLDVALDDARLVKPKDRLTPVDAREFVSPRRERGVLAGGLVVPRVADETVDAAEGAGSRVRRERVATLACVLSRAVQVYLTQL